MRDLEHQDVAPIVRLSMMAAQRAGLEEAITKEIHQLVDAGVSWRFIGLALGTSSQAAWQRYRKNKLEHPQRLASQMDLLAELDPQVFPIVGPHVSVQKKNHKNKRQGSQHTD